MKEVRGAPRVEDRRVRRRCARHCRAGWGIGGGASCWSGGGGPGGIAAGLTGTCGSPSWVTGSDGSPQPVRSPSSRRAFGPGADLSSSRRARTGTCGSPSRMETGSGASRHGGHQRVPCDRTVTPCPPGRDARGGAPPPPDRSSSAMQGRGAARQDRQRRCPAAPVAVRRTEHNGRGPDLDDVASAACRAQPIGGDLLEPPDGRVLAGESTHSLAHLPL